MPKSRGGGNSAVDASPLDAQQRRQASLHRDEICLRFDHRTQVLVRRGDLVEHASVLAALDARSLRNEVLDRGKPPVRTNSYGCW